MFIYSFVSPGVNRHMQGFAYEIARCKLFRFIH